MVGALLIPVCADWAKRGASGSAREREGAIHPRRTRVRKGYRADLSQTDIRNAFASYPACGIADESVGRIEGSIRDALNSHLAG